VEDRIEHKPGALVVTKNRHLWRVIPQSVAYDYIPAKFHQEIKTLIQQGAAVNPLFYRADKNLVHKLRVLKDQWRYKKRYASSMEKAN